MASKKLKLVINLIPESCFKASISKSMPEAEWDKISREVMQKADNACEICGSKEKVACKEVWQYDDKQHVQKLKGLRATCRMCFAVEHFGLSQVLAMKGYLNLNEVIKHFCKVNDTTWDDFNKHKEIEFTKQRERSGKKWKTDFDKWKEMIFPDNIKKKKK